MNAAENSNQSDHNDRADNSGDAADVTVVTRDDLPLHCPTADSPLWASHPRVFIPVEESGEASCPYCGNRFRLVTKA